MSDANTRYVIIGGGPAASNALETLRDIDSQASITVISNEPLHSRMALPYWLSGQIPQEHTHTADDNYFKSLDIDARIGVKASAINTANKLVQLDDGSTVAFDKLLIATGSSPIGLPIPGSDLDGVQSLWTLNDTQSALNATGSPPRAVMIGSGFIGFIMLNAMYKRGWSLAVVEREAHVLPRMLNAQAAGLVSDWLNQKNVALHTAAAATEITENNDGSKCLHLANGTRIDADLVVVATGVQPNLQLLQGTGISVADGVQVNQYMQTSHPDIYAAGDIVQGANLLGGVAEIHAIQPTAIDQGRIAAANMTGQQTAYAGSLAMNVLDVCGLQCASYGDWLNHEAEAMSICNEQEHIYRRMIWQDDRMIGSMFVGKANDLGMLTDIGMSKGMIQTHTAVGSWKDYLAENPFDIRRVYVGTQVAAKLAQTTLLGKPAQSRRFRFKGTQAGAAIGNTHQQYVQPLNTPSD